MPPGPTVWVRYLTSSGSEIVEPSTFEETTATAPISPSARAVVSTTPYATPHRIDGSVMRLNACQLDAPSVDAACSCSSPTSISTGATSRTTNGSDTNTVASTMPGSEKITWNGSSIQPSRP